MLLRTHRMLAPMFSQCARRPTIRTFSRGFARRRLETNLTASSVFEPVRDSKGDEMSGQVKSVSGFLSVMEGNRIALWSKSGLLETIDGPARRFVFSAKYKDLTRYVAGPDEFIQIKKTDGSVKHIIGPAHVYEDPVNHEAVGVYSAMRLNTNEALVVYRDDSESVQRAIITGPATYMPQADNEWVHQFVWHGTDPVALAEGINRKQPCSLRFTKLRLIPDQLYYDVEKVRTRDDALLTVKVMIFYQLKDIDQMINTTHDVTSELINSTAADVIELTSKLTFDEFRGAAGDLNELETYAQLLKKAGSIGYEVTKVVFRGYEASSKLQTMHDQAIEARTQLRLQAESEEQEQDLNDFRQEKRLDRDSNLRDEAQRVAEHDIGLVQLRADADQQRIEQQKASDRAIRQKEHELSRQTRQDNLADSAAHYKRLQDMGVDLDKFLAPKPDQHRVLTFEGGMGEGGEGKGVSSHLHLHETDDINK